MLKPKRSVPKAKHSISRHVTTVVSFMRTRCKDHFFCSPVYAAKDALAYSTLFRSLLETCMLGKALKLVFTDHVKDELLKELRKPA